MKDLEEMGSRCGASYLVKRRFDILQLAGADLKTCAGWAFVESIGSMVYGGRANRC